MLGAALGAVGSIASSFLGSKQAKKNIKLQKDFAQKGIQWKVADAKAAGIHPIFALGANTHSFSPVSVGGPDLSFLGDMGANIDRARMATSGPQVRGMGKVLEGLTLERASLENDLLRSQIRRANMTGPAMPSAVLSPDTNQPLRSTDPSAWITTNPNLGQTAENAYSDIGGNIFGTIGMLEDLQKNIYAAGKRLGVHDFFRTRNYSRPNPLRR